MPPLAEAPGVVAGRVNTPPTTPPSTVLSLGAAVDVTTSILSTRPQLVQGLPAGTGAGRATGSGGATGRTWVELVQAESAAQTSKPAYGASRMLFPW